MYTVKRKKKIYPSSNFIVVQINCCSGVLYLRLQLIDKAPCRILSEPNVITAASPLPVAISFWLFVPFFYATTSGYFVLSALKGDFMCNGGGADGVEESRFSSGWNRNVVPVGLNLSLSKGCL